MKAIIDGKTYDTKTATLIGGWQSSDDRRDWRRVDEDLYVTAKGQYFIAGEGGPLTSYAVSTDGQGGRCSGERIRLVTKQEAMKFLEEHGLTAALEEHFADEIQEG